MPVCGGATSTNTDSASVSGSTGSNETLTLDMSEAFFGPGFSSEFNIPEIELATALGDLTDTLVIIGSNANDLIAAGQNGVAIDSDGDLDVTLSPGQHAIEVHGLGGDDLLNMRGQGGAGPPISARCGSTARRNDELIASHQSDFVYGGDGNDIIFLHQLNDYADGGPGNDSITGGEGNDDIVGGPGADTFNAGAGNDTLHADDGVADIQLHGGADVDTAYYDANLDPATIAVENKFADPARRLRRLRPAARAHTTRPRRRSRLPSLPARARRSRWSVARFTSSISDRLQHGDDGEHRHDQHHGRGRLG